ncbi:MAG: restriction endonuclease, partial [Oscillospiraceae bacterium]|nr:restriction endonuclease [Oscillospiraceae bacterium]
KNTILIECKKYRNSVKKEVVNALQAKLQSLGAQKGIIISTSGFQSGAVQYAEKHGIALWQVFDNYIKHISASANNQMSDYMKLQLEVEKHLPKYFIMEWDYSLDYPITQLYPTEEMQQEAWKEAAKQLRKNLASSL